MNIGELRHVAIVQKPSGSTDDWGQPSTAMVEHARVWCRLRNTTLGNESERAGAVTSVTKTEIRTRYRTDITTGMQFVLVGKTYRIVAVRPNEMNREWTDFDCELIV